MSQHGNPAVAAQLEALAREMTQVGQAASALAAGLKERVELTSGDDITEIAMRLIDLHDRTVRLGYLVDRDVCAGRS